MSISEPFIRRPIGTALLTIGLAFFGLLAYLQLPVSDLPSVDFPTIQVSASLPGASPETMATAVALATFVLYVAVKFVGDLGGAGLLSPLVAAWSPAVVASLLGAFALLHQEDG